MLLHKWLWTAKLCLCGYRRMSNECEYLRWTSAVYKYTRIASMRLSQVSFYSVDFNCVDNRQIYWSIWFDSVQFKWFYRSSTTDYVQSAVRRCKMWSTFILQSGWNWCLLRLWWRLDLQSKWHFSRLSRYKWMRYSSWTVRTVWLKCDLHQYGGLIPVLWVYRIASC